MRARLPAFLAAPAGLTAVRTSPLARSPDRLLLVFERIKAHRVSCLALMPLACHAFPKAPTVFALAAHACSVVVARTARAAFGLALPVGQPAGSTRSLS